MGIGFKRTWVGMKIPSRFADLLTKLKYLGISTEDLITIYKLFIRCIPENCSTAFHSSLNKQFSQQTETIQSTSLKMILSDIYISYSAALEICNVQRL